MLSVNVFSIFVVASLSEYCSTCCAQYTIQSFINGFALDITRENNYTDGPSEFDRPVRVSEFPYQIALYRDNYFICGGAIISLDWVLTSADCVHGGGNFGIRAGSSSNAEGGQIRHVATIVINSGYNPISKDYNIAMLRVGQSFLLSRFVRPVAIAGLRRKVPMKMLVTGWRFNAKNPVESDNQLRAMELRYVPNDTCSISYPHTASVSKDVLCAMALGNDTCHGNSGSPMAYEGALYGIQSIGAGCLQSDMSGIFINVQRQAKWIQTVAKRFGGEMPTFLYKNTIP